MKKSKPVKSDKKQKKLTKPEKEDLVQQKPFDFGGIPDRNLKKNLGCG